MRKLLKTARGQGAVQQTLGTSSKRKLRREEEWGRNQGGQQAGQVRQKVDTCIKFPLSFCVLLSCSYSQVPQWISPAAELCTTLNLKMKGSWVLKRVISSHSLTRLMRTGMRGCSMASQASSPSIMWRFWLLCPIRMSCWLAHLFLTQIVKFNHCFGNAAYNTSQVQAAVVQVTKPHWVRFVDLCDPTRVMVMDGIFLAWWAWHVLFKYHLRPARIHRTAVDTVLRRMWLLRIWPSATSQINHPAEDVIYHPGPSQGLRFSI